MISFNFLARPFNITDQSVYRWYTGQLRSAKASLRKFFILNTTTKQSTGRESRVPATC